MTRNCVPTEQVVTRKWPVLGLETGPADFDRDNVVLAHKRDGEPSAEVTMVWSQQLFSTCNFWKRLKGLVKFYVLTKTSRSAQRLATIAGAVIHGIKNARNR